MPRRGRACEGIRNSRNTEHITRGSSMRTRLQQGASVSISNEVDCWTHGLQSAWHVSHFVGRNVRTARSLRKLPCWRTDGHWRPIITRPRYVIGQDETYLLTSPMGDADRLSSKRARQWLLCLSKSVKSRPQLGDGGFEANDNLGPVAVLAALLQRATHEHGNDPPLVVQNSDGCLAYWVTKPQGTAR